MSENQTSRFYYPLQDNAEDIDRVIHDLVQITDEQESIDKVVKVIDVNGTPHFWFGNVSSQDQIEVDDWEIPIGDGNDWVRKSNAYITSRTGSIGYSTYSFTKPLTSPSTTFEINNTHATQQFYLSYKISYVKKNNAFLTPALDSFNNFLTAIPEINNFLGFGYMLFNGTTMNPNSIVLCADRCYYYENLSTNKYEWVTNDNDATHYGLLLRNREDQSEICGAVLFKKDNNSENNDISIFIKSGFASKYELYVTTSSTNEKIEFDVQAPNKDSLLKKFSKIIGMTCEQSNNNASNFTLTFDSQTEVTKEMSIGSKGECQSIFFGFDVGNKVGEQSPFYGGVMIKDRGSTLWAQENSMLELSRNAYVGVTGGHISIELGSQTYTGPNNIYNTLTDIRSYTSMVNSGNGPALVMHGKAAILMQDKAGMKLAESSLFQMEGRSLLNIGGYSKTNIAGASTVSINGNASPGSFSGTITFQSGNHTGKFTFNEEVFVTSEEFNVINQIKNSSDLSNLYVFSIFENMYIRENARYTGTITQAEKATATIQSFTFHDSFRANGTYSLSEDMTSIATNQKKFYEGGRIVGNRQAYVMINGGSSITMSPGNASDPCVSISGASVLVMNNHSTHTVNINNVDQQYVSVKASQGYGPLFLLEEQSFQYYGYGSYGATNNGQFALKKDYMTFTPPTIGDLEDLLKEYLSNGYCQDDVNQTKYGIIMANIARGGGTVDTPDTYFTYDSVNKIITQLKQPFFDLLPLSYGRDGVDQDVKIYVGNSSVILGGKEGSNAWIKIGGDPGQYTQVHILDNSHVETKINSTLCIRGYNPQEYSWSNVPSDNGGSNVTILDNAIFSMRGVWDDSNVAPGDEIPLGLEHPVKKSNATLFEMTDNSEFRMWGNSLFKMDSNGITFSDGVDSITFTIQELIDLFNGGSQLPNAEDAQF